MKTKYSNIAIIIIMILYLLIVFYFSIKLVNDNREKELSNLEYKALELRDNINTRTQP